MPEQIHRQQLEEYILSSTEAVQRLWKSFIMASIEKKSLTPAQFFAMHEIARHQGTTAITSGKLCELMHVTPGAVTQIIDVLVDEGFAVRAPHPSDRRAHQILLTETGRQELERVNRHRKKLFVTMFGALSDQELQQLHDLQSKMLEHLEELHTEKNKENEKGK